MSSFLSHAMLLGVALCALPAWAGESPFGYVYTTDTHARGEREIEQWLTRLSGLRCDEEWLSICQNLTDALASGKSVEEFTDSIGLQKGVTGYAYHSVPVALYALVRHRNDFHKALESALDCGGDTDTVGAIVGAIVGAKFGKEGLPPELIAGVCDWPRSVSLLEQIAARLAQQQDSAQAVGPVRYFWPGLILRNLLFVVVVLIHGFRRLECGAYESLSTASTRRFSCPSANF